MSAIAKGTNAGTLVDADALALLRLVQSYGGKVSMVRLRAEDPARDTKRNATTVGVNQLRAQRLVKAFKPTPRDGILVEITREGRAALAGATFDGFAAMPAPAAVVDLERKRGERAAHQVRTIGVTTSRRNDYDGADLTRMPPRGAASLHAFTLPSLVNGVCVPRTRPPIIMGGSRPDRARDDKGRA